MKHIIAWIKANIAIVVSLVVIVVVLPTAFIFSSSWNGKIKAAQEKAANDLLTKVNGAKVSYTIPSFEPGVEAITLQRVPNPEVTEWFKKAREGLKGQADAVVKRIEDFNRGVGPDAQAVGRHEHTLFTPELFAAAAKAEAQLKAKLGEEKFNALSEDDRKKQVGEIAKGLEDTLLFEMESKLLGKRGNPNPYEQILASMHAGGPADPVTVLEAVNTLKARELQQRATGRQPTPEESALIAKSMSEQRLAEYLGHAGSISVYATMDSLPSGNTDQAIPRDKIPPERLRTIEFFLYQWDYWVLDDIAAAVRFANARAADGEPLPIPEAPIKRVEKIVLKTPEALAPRQDGFGAPTGAADPAPEAPGMLPRDLSISFTGHNTGKWNQVYDARRAEITMVVSSAQLPEVVASFARVNLMAVNDIDVSEVDVWTDIQDGYAYGPDHVVRVKLTVESLWLRTWLKSVMPKDIRAAFGVADDAPAPKG